MNFEKKNNIYKAIMLVLITALITFLLTSIGMYNYLNKGNGLVKTLVGTETSDLDTKIQIVRAYLDELYLGEINEDELVESAVKGYVTGLGDEYTEYLTKSEYEELMIDVNGNYVGIGVYMTQDIYDNIIVLLPIEGSPAEAADLRTGDIIKKVNGEDCTGLELDAVANKIKGEEGSTVVLEIERDGEILNKTVERKNVKINQIKTQVLDNDIGYIQILSFDEDCSVEFEKKLDELINKGIKSLIIDVRDNGGGIVEESNNIADLFLEKGKTIMIEIDKEGNEEQTKAENDAKISSDINVVVLANEYTASASEILIGALKDNGVAKVVGTKTYGKGVMQEIVPVSTGGALKITIEEFHTPNGNAINKKGIEPDVFVEENEKTAKDEQLQRAIQECNK